MKHTVSSRPHVATVQIRQRGFTLVEMLIAIVVATMMLMTMTQALTPALNFYAKQETESRLKDLREAIVGAYKMESRLVDRDQEAVFKLQRGNIAPVLPNAGRCPSTEATFVPMGAYLAGSASVAWRDGYGQGMCFMVTERLTGTFKSSPFDYRSMAVISPGADGVIEPGSTLTADGVLTLEGDDKGFLVDGKQIVGDMMADATERIERAANVLGVYFMTRFRSNPARDISVNYFATHDPSGSVNAAYDANGFVPTSAASPNRRLPLQSRPDLVAQLGMSSSDAVDPWGGSLFLDNSSDLVRHPGNSQPNSRLPPYTARVGAILPNGTFLEKTVVGYY